MNKTVQALFASAFILFLFSCAGCGRSYSTQNYLIWRVTQRPDGSRQIAFEGAADRFAIKALHTRIVCFGAECFSEDNMISDDSGASDGLIAVQFPPATREDGRATQRICKLLFPSYQHFALASLLGRMHVCHEIVLNDETVAELADVMMSNPSDAMSYYGRGTFYVQTGQYDRAISDYNRAIEMDPQFAQAFYDRGVAHYRKGQHALALSDYARAVEINPQLHEHNDMFVRLVREKWARSKERQRS